MPYLMGLPLHKRILILLQTPETYYLDFFIFAGEAFTNDFEIPMNTFLKISEELGVPIAINKTVHPTTVLTFLGLEIDTVLMVVRIPSCKLLKLKSFIEELLIR
jgi:hypothetical protein